MKNHTTDISERAWSIALREAEIVWNQTNGNWDAYWEAFGKSYDQACQELASNLETEVAEVEDES